MAKIGRPKKNPQGGAPKGNRNNLTHGVHSYLATGKLPKGAQYIGRLVGQFRNALEQVVVDRHGEVSLYHAAVIQSATRHEASCCLLQRWLREAEERLTIPERAQILKQFSALTDRRDACLKELGLDKSEAHDLTAIYSLPPLPPPEEPEPTAETPSETPRPEQHSFVTDPEQWGRYDQ